MMKKTMMTMMLTILNNHKVPSQIKEYKVGEMLELLWPTIVL